MVVEKQAINKTKNTLNYTTLTKHHCQTTDESVCGVSILHQKFLFALNNQHLYVRYTKHTIYHIY